MLRILSSVFSSSSHLSPTSLYILSVSFIISEDDLRAEDSGMDSPSSTKIDEHVSYTSFTLPCAWKTVATILGLLINMYEKQEGKEARHTHATLTSAQQNVQRQLIL